MALINRYGKIEFNYRKVHLYEYLVNDAACIPGNDFFVCDLNTKNGDFKLGAMICADRDGPESARLLMLKGAEIVIIPNACPLQNSLTRRVETRAAENAIGIVMVNYPEPKWNGGSVAFYPWGDLFPKQKGENLIFEADEKENIHIVSFDINRLREFRSHTLGGNACRYPNAYKLLIDTEISSPFNSRKNAIGIDYQTTKRK